MMFSSRAAALSLLSVASTCTTLASASSSSHSTTQTDPERDSARDAFKNVPAYPDFRYTAWDDLDTSIRDEAHAIGYQGKSWNKPGSQDIEKLDWESQEEKTRAHLTTMGFSAPQWDCYMNHYRSYEWEELDDEAASLEVKGLYKTLGWSHETWDADETPALEGKYWDDLAAAEKQAAGSLCYTQAIWDEIMIPLWGEDDGNGSSEENDNQDGATDEEVVDEKTDTYETIYDPNDRSTFDGPTGPSSAHNSRDIPLPMFRYNTWDNLDPLLQHLAKNAKYDEKHWNSFSLKGLESKDFETIGVKYPDGLKSLKAMGFTEKQWDCYISHYKSYEWDELEVEGVQKYFKALGWSHQMWDESDEPDVFGMYWPDLSKDQQNAAYELCYFRETWDDVSLQFWPRTSSNTDWKAYAKAHPAAVGGVSFVTVTFLVGMIFAVAYCLRTRRVPRGSSQKDNDLEMYGNDLDGYRDDPIDEDAHEGEGDEYGETKEIA